MGKDEARLLASFVERLERLEGEKKGLSDDIKEIYAEAKEKGFDVKALAQCVRLKKVNPAERAAYEARLDEYRGALGLLADLPLGRAAMERASAHAA